MTVTRSKPAPNQRDEARGEFCGLVGRYEVKYYPMVAADARLEWWAKPSEVELSFYRGYTAHVYFDGSDQIYVGHITGIQDIVGFRVEATTELESAFHMAVDNYIDMKTRLPPRQGGLG
jgi:hypothetical protein